MNAIPSLGSILTAIAICIGLNIEAKAAAPAITRQPQGTSVLAGSATSLSVQGDSPTPITYQWLLNSNVVAKATNASYSIPVAKKANEGNYQVVLSNASGAITTQVARVIVITADYPAITNGLVAHFTFEGNPNDTSGHGNNGVVVGRRDWIPTGRAGGAGLHFTTLSDGSIFNFVTLGQKDDFAFGADTDFSVCFWIEYTTPLGEFPLIANKVWSDPNSQGWGIAAGPDGGLRWNFAGPPGATKSYVGTGGTLNDGTWHHVAVTFRRSGNVTTYLDGVEVNSQSLALSSNDITTLSDLALNVGQDGTGAFTGDGAAGIDAGMDDLGIWTRVISAEEVAWIHGKGLRGVHIRNNAFDLGGAQVTRVTGQWDFDQEDLRATVGEALEYGDGPGGAMEGQTHFGTTTSFGIADIGGQVGKVMKYERNETPPDNYVAGYTMHHGIAPNGGGTKVNRWTLITDILIPDLFAGDRYTAVIEIQNDVNSDADVSIHGETPGIGGIGISGQYPGAITQGEWHRIVVAVDMAGAVPVISKFMDGAKIADQVSADKIGFDNRFSLNDVAHLFSDGEHDNEVNTYYVNSVQIRDGKLSDDEVAALGGPEAGGIPLPNRVTGQWDFDQEDLRATVGEALEYGDGPGGAMEGQTHFGTTTSFGIADIGGQVGKVMKYERNETPPDNYVAGYTMHHGIAPNGGGTKVNRWTLITDILIPDLFAGDRYTAVIEIQNDVNSDADVSIHGETPGIGGIGISGQYPGAITQGEWHRIVVAVDMAGAVPVISKFMDGAKIADQVSADKIGFDNRFSLNDVAHLFSDGEHDNEVNTYYVNSVQIRDGKLSDDEVAALGGPEAGGIPLPNRVTGQWDFDQEDLRATVGEALEYGDGPGGAMEGQTHFGTTTSFGIADIGGQVGKVMKYERNETPPDNYVAGYTMHHGIAPNGGGTKVNRWTLITDILIPDLFAGDRYTAVIEIQNDVNSDADVSIHGETPGIGGIGISGQYPGAITQGEWHRIVVAVDMAGAVPVISKFMDGAKIADQVSADKIGFDNRFSLNDVAHLFSDGEHDNEVNTYYVNSVQIRDGKLSDDEVAALGGPEAGGIPTQIPSGTPPTVRPKLVLSLTGKTLTISWNPGSARFELESTDQLASPNWVSVTGVNNNSIQVNVGSGTKFYRLQELP